MKYFTSSQASRDLVSVVHITLQDPAIHHLGQLQVVLHHLPRRPAAPAAPLPLHLLLPGKFASTPFPVSLHLLLPGKFASTPSQ